MESLMKWFPNLHKNSGLIRGKEVCVCVCGKCSKCKMMKNNTYH